MYAHIALNVFKKNLKLKGAFTRNFSEPDSPQRHEGRRLHNILFQLGVAELAILVYSCCMTTQSFPQNILLLDSKFLAKPSLIMRLLVTYSVIMLKT